MAVTHGTATRNKLATQILTDIDIGTAGSLVFRTSGDVEVATLALSAVSGVVAGAVLTFSTVSDDTNATGGTTTKFTIEDSSSVAVLFGAVAVSGADINLSSTNVSAGDTVAVTSLTYTAPV